MINLQALSRLLLFFISAGKVKNFALTEY